jgi:hypothetical protein
MLVFHRGILNLTVLGMLISLVMLPFAADARGRKSDEPDPDRREMDIYKGDQKKIGNLSYKWVITPQGTIFASSTFEIRTGSGKLFIRTHLKKNSEQKIEKYKKWIGRSGAKPALIAFWNEGRFRVIKKVDGRFKRDLKPAKDSTFVVLDEFALHLYQELVVRWKQGANKVDALLANEGKMAQVTIKRAGIDGTVSKKGKKDVPLQALNVSIDGKTVNLFIGEKGELWAVREGKLLAVRKGWTLKETAAAEVPIEQVKDLAPVKAPDAEPVEVEEDKTDKPSKTPKPLPID